MNLDVVKKVINEATFSKLYRNMQDKTVGILTAYRLGNSSRVNKERNKELEKDLRSYGLGFNKVTSFYKEYGEDKVSQEVTFVVYTDKDKEWLKDVLVKLGDEYDQDTIIVVDKDNGAFLIGATGKDVNYPKGKEEYIGRFTPSKIAEIYSKMGKDTFVFESRNIEGQNDAYARRLVENRHVHEGDSYQMYLEKLQNNFTYILENNTELMIDILENLNKQKENINE